MTRIQLIAAIAAALVGGIAFGVAGYTFVYAKGASYLTNNPEACANCHIMRNHYNAWTRSPHHNVAVCNDCHAPHDFFGKYAIKGINGFNHSLAFTTGRFHEPIQIKSLNKSVTENACRYCHQDIVQMIDSHDGIEPLSCIRCHSEVGHIE
jgi:cytochrome c nitrite reductase small subunit